MSTALELQWRSQAERRRRIIKLMLMVTFGFAIVTILLCLWVPQPLFSRPKLSQTSDPARLQGHVQMLSIQCSPRDQSHTDNLDRAAAYIREQFLEASGRVIEQPFDVEGRTYRNVVASFGPE